MIGRAEIMANTTGNLVIKNLRLNIYNLAIQELGEAAIDGHGLLNKYFKKCNISRCFDWVMYTR